MTSPIDHDGLVSLAEKADFAAFGAALASFIKDEPTVRKVEMNIAERGLSKPCFTVTVYLRKFIKGYANSYAGWNHATQKYDDESQGEAAFMHTCDTPLDGLMQCIEQYKRVSFNNS